VGMLSEEEILKNKKIREDNERKWHKQMDGSWWSNILYGLLFLIIRPVFKIIWWWEDRYKRKY